MAVRFTLVELMIVVAILMVLTAIALPLVADMQLRAKRAELFPNLRGIADAARIYEAEVGIDAYTNWTPSTSGMGKEPRPWSGTGSWALIGWEPDGEVRGVYRFRTSFHTMAIVDDGWCVCEGCSSGLIDADGDGVSSADHEAWYFMWNDLPHLASSAGMGECAFTSTPD